MIANVTAYYFCCCLCILTVKAVPINLIHLITLFSVVYTNYCICIRNTYFVCVNSNSISKTKQRQTIALLRVSGELGVGKECEREEVSLWNVKYWVSVNNNNNNCLYLTHIQMEIYFVWKSNSNRSFFVVVVVLFSYKNHWLMSLNYFLVQWHTRQWY